MLKKTLSALALAAAFINPASASAIYHVQETFASGATFDGQVTFNDSLDLVESVDGYLSGAAYGNDHIDWVWWTGFSGVDGTGRFNFLMDGAQPSFVWFLSFAWDISNAANLTFSNVGQGNNVSYTDAMVSGSITPVVDLPEPGSIALLGMGLLGLAARRRKA